MQVVPPFCTFRLYSSTAPAYGHLSRKQVFGKSSQRRQKKADYKSAFYEIKGKREGNFFMLQMF